MIFISGASGFLGSYVAKILIDKGYKVRSLKRPNTSLELLGDYADRMEWAEGDVLDVVALHDAMQGAEQVIHSAAVVSFVPSQKYKMLKVNIEGTANMVNTALELGVKRFVHISSISAFGRGKIAGMITEDTEFKKDKDNTNYSISKFQSEQEVWRGYYEGLNMAILNPSTIIGAGRWTEGSARLIGRVAEGLKFYTPGRNGYVDVRDVADLTVRLLESDISGERFIVSAENLHYKQLFDLMAKYLGVKAPDTLAKGWMRELAWRMEWLKSKISGRNPLITKETARFAQFDFQYDNSKIRETFNFEFRPIEQTIKETCEAYKQSKEKGQAYSTFGGV